MNTELTPEEYVKDYETRHGIAELTCDIDSEKTVFSDIKEFSKSKGGFDTYVQKLKEQYFAKDLVSDISLPAHSSNGKSSCGQLKFLACRNHTQHQTDCFYCQKTVMSCNSRGCVICFESAIRREARSITDRMVTFTNLKKNRKIYLKNNRTRLLSHVVVSIPFEEHHLMNTRKGRKQLKQKQIKILKQLDVDGGVTISHPYRFSNELESAYLSPHFHNIITGWIDGNITSQINKETGWVVSQIRTLDSEKDCYGLSKYLLSHSGVYEKEVGKRSSEHSVSYFGECQNRLFKVERVLKNSVNGYEELDKLLIKKNTVKYKKINYPIQKISYTYTVISDSIKESTNEYHEIIGNIRDITKSLREYITPILNRSLDKPAFSQSEQEQIPLEFLQIRLDYGNSQYSIVQSEYLNIILDSDLSQLCPECSEKMEILIPPEEWSYENQRDFQILFKSMKEDEIIQCDNICGLVGIRENFNALFQGMPYFNSKGESLIDSGIHSLPECINELGLNLRHLIIKNQEFTQKKYDLKIKNGETPTTKELIELLCVPTIPIRVTTKDIQKITNFV